MLKKNGKQFKVDEPLKINSPRWVKFMHKDPKTGLKCNGWLDIKSNFCSNCPYILSATNKEVAVAKDREKRVKKHPIATSGQKMVELI